MHWTDWFEEMVSRSLFGAVRGETVEPGDPSEWKVFPRNYLECRSRGDRR